MKAGNDETIMDLEDTPDFVLVQFCSMILRHRDLRDPEHRQKVQGIVSALKAKAEKPGQNSISSFSLSKSELESYIALVEDILLEFS